MEKQTGRIEAFSDGIFGVAITLLAIELGIDLYNTPTDKNLWEKILEKWPEYVSFFNSFATVLLIWVGHHRIFNRLRFASLSTILLNGLVLMFVVLLPYPTRLVGHFIFTPAVHTAVAFYTITIGLIVLSMFLLNISIMRNKNQLTDPMHTSWFKSQIKMQAIAISLYAIAAILSFYIPSIALIITFAMWIFWAFNIRDTTFETE